MMKNNFLVVYSIHMRSSGITLSSLNSTRFLYSPIYCRTHFNKRFMTIREPCQTFKKGSISVAVAISIAVQHIHILSVNIWSHNTCWNDRVSNRPNPVYQPDHGKRNRKQSLITRWLNGIFALCTWKFVHWRRLRRWNQFLSYGIPLKSCLWMGGKLKLTYFFVDVHSLKEKS